MQSEDEIQPLIEYSSLPNLTFFDEFYSQSIKADVDSEEVIK